MPTVLRGVYGEARGCWCFFLLLAILSGLCEEQAGADHTFLPAAVLRGFRREHAVRRGCRFLTSAVLTDVCG
jgi:hypothetical protein